MSDQVSPAVKVAKEHADSQNEKDITVLSTGVRARLSPVSSTLLMEVGDHIKDPEVPKQFNEDLGREEENPLHPGYQAALREAETQRGLASMDAMIMFGVDLVDGVPEDDSWITKLRWMEKRGKLNLSEYDLDDPIDKEFLYKRYIAITNADLDHIAGLSSVNPKEVERMRRTFPGEEGEYSSS